MRFSYVSNNKSLYFQLSSLVRNYFLEIIKKDWIISDVDEFYQGNNVKKSSERMEENVKQRKNTFKCLQNSH